MKRIDRTEIINNSATKWLTKLLNEIIDKIKCHHFHLPMINWQKLFENGRSKFRKKLSHRNSIKNRWSFYSKVANNWSKFGYRTFRKIWQKIPEWQNWDSGKLKYFKLIIKVEFIIWDLRGHQAKHLSLISTHFEIISLLMIFPHFHQSSLISDWGNHLTVL